MSLPDTVECPECGAEIEIIEDTIEGEIIECPECLIELEVTEDGVEIAPEEGEEEEEDWEE